MEVRRYLPVEGAEEVAILNYLNSARQQKRLTRKDEKTLLARSGIWRQAGHGKAG